MSKYEKHAWAVGIYAFLATASLFLFHLSVTDSFFFLLFFLGMSVGFNIVNILWPYPWKDYLEMETHAPYKATSWTFYGVAVITLGLITCLWPREPISVSWDAIGMAMIHTSFLFMGIRFIVLAFLLRKERLSSSTPLQLGASPDANGGNS